MKDGFENIVNFFNKYLNDDATPYTTYKKMIKIINELENKSVYLEELKNYRYMNIGNNILSLIKFFSPNIEQKYNFLSLKFIIMQNAIIGEDISAEKTHSCEPSSFPIIEMKNIIDDTIDKKYGEGWSHEVTDMEEIKIINGFKVKKDFPKTWEEDFVKISFYNIPFKLKVFIMNNNDGNIILLPRKEKEKLMLGALILNCTELKNVNLNFLSESTSISDFLYPYISLMNLYMDQKKFAIKRHFFNSPELSNYVLNAVASDMKIKQDFITMIDMHDWSEIHNVNIYKINDHYITITPGFMIKTDYLTKNVLDKAISILDKAVEEKYGKITASIRTFSHGNYYRVKINGKININNVWKEDIITIDRDIKVKTQIFRNFIKINEIQLGKFYSSILSDY